MTINITTILNKLGYNATPCEIEVDQNLEKVIKVTPKEWSQTEEGPYIPISFFEDAVTSKINEMMDLIFETFLHKNIPKAMDEAPVGNLFERDYVLSHITIRLSNGTEHLHKQSFVRKNGLLKNIYESLEIMVDEEYAKIFDDYEGEEAVTFSVTPEILDFAGITEEEAWKTAKQNVIDSSEIYIFQRKPLFAYLSNKSGCLGASCISNVNLINSFMEDMGVKRLVMIPSTVHSVALMTVPDEIPDDEILCDNKLLATFTRNSNVRDIEKLTDEVIILKKEHD